MTDDVARDEAEARAELEQIRQSIDNIDAALIHLLAERFKFTQKVGRLKAAHGLPAADLDREARQIARLRALAEESHLDPAFAEKFLGFIVAEVIHHHERIASGAAD
ncbi:chorismate mutase [Rathayibacter sp. VKM Ac-2803]|uniref:chorismate mutase n=1 Tax=unclassified Rathayibacter TaxID=2609250 RepID=UPI0013577803|nr:MULTISPECIES: chorismate mutase [unclassified Rathayibacter]MWV48402.1 chorismate mutase [Rathayibacter sp. VKM Ac-2803]MWV59106.1 chorismate mutase [Rathayibacter sp. VKM Ac-2754]